MKLYCGIYLHFALFSVKPHARDSLRYLIIVRQLLRQLSPINLIMIVIA